jgi:glycosyltransferase involved in cell wall biosynthesis
MDLSIIVPVYNVEKYLVRCLDSIFSQPFSGTCEVIAVDDGSTDACPYILSRYQKKEPRLKIITHEENKKLSLVRATGMSAATGDYIMHVDSDDWLLPDSLDRLLKTCRETDADVVVFNYVREDDERQQTSVKPIKRQLVTSDKHAVQQYFYGACWNKIVKRKFTCDMVYTEIGVNLAEDLLYSTEILLKVQTICLTPATCYVYCENTSSITMKIKPHPRLCGTMLIMEQLAKVFAIYQPGPRFVRNVTAYMEKLIFEAVAVNEFIEHDALPEKDALIRSMAGLYHNSEKLPDRISDALEHKYYCLMQVVRRSGIKIGLGIFRRGVMGEINLALQERW